MNLCIFNGTVSTKIYDKRDDFDFHIVNFPFLDGDSRVGSLYANRIFMCFCIKSSIGNRGEVG